MSIDRKAKIREYKEAKRPAGIYRVRHRRSGRQVVGASVDLPSALNRQRAQLRMGMHPDRELQRIFEAEGAETFEFEILDELPAGNDPDYDPRADLKVLEELWAEKLAASDEDQS